MENNQKNREFIAQKAIDSFTLQEIFDALIYELSDRYRREPHLFESTVYDLDIEPVDEPEIDEYMALKPVLVLAPDTKEGE